MESASAATLCLLLLMETNLCRGGLKSELETDVVQLSVIFGRQNSSKANTSPTLLPLKNHGNFSQVCQCCDSL